MPTVPAPPTPVAPRSPSAQALCQFGTIGDQLYWAWVLAEEERAARLRTKGIKR